MLILMGGQIGEVELSALAEGAAGSSASAVVAGLYPGASVQRGGYVLSSLPLEIDRGSHVDGSPETSVEAHVAAAQATVAGAVVLAEEPPSEPSYGDFTVRNMLDLNIVAAGAGIYTTLSIRYDYDWATKEFRKALLLQAPEKFRDYGRVPFTLEAKWLKSPRQAFLLGERLLQYLSRPRWSISFADGIQSAAIPPGVWVTATHPHVPVAGRMLVMDSELDTSSASVRLTIEAVVGDPPAIVLAKLSEAYAPQLPEGVNITYVAGHAVITVYDEESKPIPGAQVTLDGGLTLKTDTFGKVSFQTGRGAHHLTIEAAGYVTQELDVQV